MSKILSYKDLETENESKILTEKAEEILKILYGLIKSLNNKIIAENGSRNLVNP